MGERAIKAIPNWLMGAGAVCGVSALVFGVFWLQLRYASPDVIDGFTFSGEELVVLDRIHDGDGESSMPGGARHLVFDLTSGEVKSRRTLRDAGAWVTIVDDALWLRRAERLEARDARTFDVRHSADALVRRTPELGDAAEGRGCYDGETQSWTFQTKDGRYVAYALASRTAVSVPSTSCREVPATGDHGALPDGRALGFRPVPGAARRRLFAGPAEEPLAPVGDLTYLEGKLLLDPGGPPREPLLLSPSKDDVLLTRRSSVDAAGPTELVRVSLAENAERWAVAIAPTRASVERAGLQGRLLVVSTGARLTVIDADTGQVRWRHGR